MDGKIVLYVAFARRSEGSKISNSRDPVEMEGLSSRLNPGEILQ